MDIEVRELDWPIYDGLVNKYRDSRRGIQQLEDAGYDVTGKRERLDAKAARRRTTGERTKRATNAKGSLLPFIAWDGEGWTDNDLEHRYNYMANSLGQYVEYPLLTTRTCFDLLLTTARQAGKAIHVIFGSGYDVTHWCRDMPMKYRETLKKYGRVAWMEYYMEYIPHKWFKLTGPAPDANGNYRRTTVKIFDVMTFFQTSFIAALKSRKIEVPQEVVDGKAGRATFTMEDMPMIRDYCNQELQLLVKLCDTLRDEFHEAGMPIKQFYGPGAVANEVMKLYSIDKYMAPAPTTPVDIELLCCKAYFGGRFEAFQIGHRDGPTYQADIRSAYPDKIRHLPSLAGSHWEYRSEYTGELGIWRCNYRSESSELAGIHPAPWRDTAGSVYFPWKVGEVWLWTYEAQYVNAMDGYVLIIEDETKPFAFIPGMYDTRQRWKNEGKGGQHALKLALNSLYGKMAQRVGGQDGMPPKYHQLAWAGMITSMTRAQLWEAMNLDISSVIAVETDSVMTTRKLNLDYGTGLGQWELSEYQWVTYLQSGVYWTDTETPGISVRAKTRGMGAKELTHDEVMGWLAGSQENALPTMSHRFIGLTNPDRTNYGQWTDTLRELTLQGGKRIHGDRSLCAECWQAPLNEGLHRTLDALRFYAMDEYVPSKAHPLPWRTDIQPDSTEYGDERDDMEWLTRQ